MVNKGWTIIFLWGRGLPLDLETIFFKSNAFQTIAVVPNGGYDSGKCGSLKERVWLTYIDKVNEREEGLSLSLLCLDIVRVGGSIGLKIFFLWLSGNVKWSERVL